MRKLPFFLVAVLALGLAIVLGLGRAGAAEDLRAINRLLIQAGEAEQKNDYDGAIRAYSGILAIRPDDEPILLDRGGNYAGKKDFDRALADFDQAVKLKPGDAMAF